MLLKNNTNNIKMSDKQYAKKEKTYCLVCGKNQAITKLEE